MTRTDGVGILLISNPAAGGTKAEDLRAAVDVLRSGAEVETATADGPDDVDRLLDRRAGRRVVIAGGDGSLHLTLARLFARGELADTPLGLIPLGTGNDFARGAGVPLDAVPAARLVLDGMDRPVDLIVDDVGGIVINNVHVGLSSEASRHGARWKERIGRAGYPLGVLQAAFQAAFRVVVEVDGELAADADRPVLEVSVGNGATVGGGLPLNPDADPTDGTMDVIVSRAAGPFSRVTYGFDVVRARHPERPDVDRYAAAEVTVSGDPFHICGDGEIDGPTRSRTWRIERRALTMSLPTGS
ncbi:MAG TPA: diacylglycerol kinase family protein [Microlunatus sp.]|nr:diacylglycerol kinase family protein [Microlunatus sp.]